MDRLGLMVSVLAVAGSVLVSGCADKKYPRCGAFEFSPLKLIDEEADPLDCGRQRLELEANTTESLDCALQAIADGQAFRLEIQREPRGDAVEIDAVLFADEDGLAMLRQDINEDLNGTIEAKVIQLDVQRVEGCRNFEDAADRYTCFDAAMEAAEHVETCESRDWESH